MTPVATFGVHKDPDGVKWLMQGAGGENAIGLREAVPFRVQQVYRQCNHVIDLKIAAMYGENSAQAQLEYLDLEDDPVVKMMMPIPRADSGVWFHHSTEISIQTLCTLSRMTSPVMGAVRPVYAYDSPKEIFEWVNRSNIQPLVLFGIRPDHIGLMRELAEACQNSAGRLIFAAPREMYTPQGVKALPPVPPLTEDAANHGNWEAIGASALYKWMRDANN